MYAFNANLKSHNSRVLARMMAIALTTGTLFTGLAETTFAQYNPPADLGLPNRREPGGTRGACSGAAIPVDGLKLTPLMPQDNHFGQTLSGYPTFYWYVPDVTAQAAEFVLMDESGNEVYTVKFQLADSAQDGIISLALPQNAGLPPLTIDQNYHWYFSLICDEFDRGTDIFTDGWVRRVASDPAVSLQSANDYAQAGIWFEALEIVAENRREGGINPEWQALLESVGLESFVDAMFLQ